MTSSDAIPRLDRPVNDAEDHILGPNNAPITLVEYGSYACPQCRAANERIAEVRTELGDRMRYVFRHRPIPGNALAKRAAELIETAADAEQFWEAHVLLMTRSETLTEDDLRAVGALLAAERSDADDASRAEPPIFAAEGETDARDETSRRARERVALDMKSAKASGVRYTPTFFINGLRYDGAWDESSFTDALIGSLGYRMRTAALGFATWAPSTGVLLLLATALALIVSNTGRGDAFEAFWNTGLGFAFGDTGFEMSLRHWINDGLLTVFFLVVGLEIKREFTVGHLASRRSAALPIAAAIGGMAAPALVYLLIIPAGPWTMGWGVPMATDTAFAVALIAMLGRRVPVELRIFLTAAAIVDDIGAIVVVAIFYSGDLELGYLASAAILTALLVLLNRSGVYRVSPYLLTGVALWACVHSGGLHATLAGVILAATIPTRRPPDYRTLALQADSILSVEARHGGEQLRHGPSEPALRALDAIHDRLLSPADRLLRTSVPRSNYFVLPLFALANAGVGFSTEVFSGNELLMLAVGAGLVIGKPVGFVLLCVLAVRLDVATKSAALSWRQLAGAGALAGIGFTMSLFIAGQAFPVPAEFDAAKIAIFAASVLSAGLGVALLWSERRTEATEPLAQAAQHA